MKSTLNKRPGWDEMQGFDSVAAFNFPRIINVNVLSGKCYCKCGHCPVGRTPVPERTSRFKFAQLDLSLYKKIVDEMNLKSPESVLRIHAVGEPIIWNNITTAVTYSHGSGVNTWLFTCAVTKKKPLLEMLCENINIIEISINSTNAEDYKNTKGINAFKLVAGNIDFMRSIIARRNLSTRLIVSRVQSINEKVDNAFVDYWQSSGLVDDAFVRSYHTYNDLIETFGNPPTKKHEPCLVHWARFNIHVDGTVVICYNELFKEKLNPDLILGNITSSSISDIWHGETLKMVRQAELTGDYSKIPFEDELPCKNCYSCQPLFGNRHTSEHQLQKIYPLSTNL